MTEIITAINSIDSWPGAFALVGVAAALAVVIWKALTEINK